VGADKFAMQAQKMSETIYKAGPCAAQPRSFPYFFDFFDLFEFAVKSSSRTDLVDWKMWKK
jgi:hypothetical protein